MIFHRRNIRLFCLAVLTIAFVYLSGLAQRVETSPGGPSADRIHRGDLIEIDELGGFDFDWRGRLNPEGYLDRFQKVADPIYALCSTPDELAEKVRLAYSRTLRNPRIRVRILDRSERPAAILDGAIRQPSRFSIRRNVGLVELIALGGGLTDRAGGDITIFRPSGQSCERPDDEARITKLTISGVLSGDPSANPKIVSGDIVTIQEVFPLYVIGGVNRPGRTDWRPGSTVARAIAAAGGVADRGIAGSVTIYRRTPGSASLVQVNLDKVLSGDVQDVELEPYDILDVPLKGNGKRLKPPVVEGFESRTAVTTLPLRVVD